MDNSNSISWPELELDNLRAIKVLGKGAMGTVFLVYHKSNDPTARSPFALKVLDKSSLPLKPHADRRARWEISVLNRLQQPNHHQFLPYLLGVSDTDRYLCWATNYCPGGDLNQLRYRQFDRVFSPTVIRFYLAEIVCAIEKLHSMGLVYRDLKPENILIQHSGHVTLTDFDLSRFLPSKKVETLLFNSDSEIEKPKPHGRTNYLKRFVNLKNKNNGKGLKKARSARVSPVSRRNPNFTNERSNSFVGTEEYVAPEIIRGDGHEFAVDWWALGVLCYELLYGTTPFRGNNRKETFRRILMMEPEFIGKPNALTDLIKKLLAKDPTRRLGYLRGASEIKEHEFFKGLSWDLLTEVLRPPFLPSRDETEELTKGGMEIDEYFQKLKAPPSPLWSPSIDEGRRSVSLTEF
ncbi:hypothetical protein M9H77_14443 [Catharanthus roseus]|uniref:Uncharacterized protein n=1 Tax=Catharanthus roseus TaxID=4058 RepID=A0ACC0BNC6_CATRO|nr:hypothetical protein M9H77_14443 [Catharanthus roseus]